MTESARGWVVVYLEEFRESGLDDRRPTDTRCGTAFAPARWWRRPVAAAEATEITGRHRRFIHGGTEGKPTEVREGLRGCRGSGKMNSIACRRHNCALHGAVRPRLFAPGPQAGANRFHTRWRKASRTMSGGWSAGEKILNEAAGSQVGRSKIGSSGLCRRKRQVAGDEVWSLYAQVRYAVQI